MKFMKNTITPLLLFTFFLIETQLFSQDALLSTEFFSMNAEALAKEIYYSRKNSGLYDKVTEVGKKENKGKALSINAINDKWEEWVGVSLNPLNKIRFIIYMITVFPARVVRNPMNLESMYADRIDTKVARFGTANKVISNQYLKSLPTVFVEDAFIWDNVNYKGESATNIVGWNSSENAFYDIFIPK